MGNPFKRKKLQKVVSGAKKLLSKDPLIGSFMGGKDDGDSGSERGEAASQLMKKDVKRQAGGGQINYTTEEWT